MSHFDAILQATQQKLEPLGFTCTREPSGLLRLLAHRSRFELSKFGNCETFFMLGEPRDGLRDFSKKCLELALAERKLKLPCGLFESVICFPVALVEEADSATLEDLRKNAPPKHWAALEFPLLHETKTGRTTCFEGTPIWGAAYYAGLRRTAREIFPVN